MAQRKKIALTYHHSENWIAGSYYVVNILKALNSLPDADKPQIILIFQELNGLQLIRDIKYPYLTYLNLDLYTDHFSLKFIRRVSRRITGIDYWVKYNLQKVLHIFEGRDDFKFIQHHYFWVHDFQEFRLPEFFSPADAAARSALPARVAQMKDVTLILSSYDALNDFNTYFPGHLCTVKVLRFASSLPDFSQIDIQSAKAQFEIIQPYFICSNQFWQHKNHKIILEAINLLKEKNLSFQVVFTGKNYDFRNPDYFESLENYVKENELEKWVKFLGFIERKVQLQLAKYSLSYIQPSLFEGWSTTVEDAKCMNQYIILSDIPVHKEQIDYNVAFFNPHSASELAEKMEKILLNNIEKEIKSYNENIKQFGRDVLNVFSNAD